MRAVQNISDLQSVNFFKIKKNVYTQNTAKTTEKLLAFLPAL